MRLDRKLLLIAPTIVLGCIVLGLLYATMQLHVLASVSDSWKDRSDFVNAVQRGEKKMNDGQAVNVLRFALDVEAKRTAAIVATRDLLIVLSLMTLASCIVLAIGIRSVPREHWPRLSFKRSDARSEAG
ncbi:MAG TPA: hypothetical protein VGM50_00660 [Gemmatimonadaceae bacterium]